MQSVFTFNLQMDVPAKNCRNSEIINLRYFLVCPGLSVSSKEYKKTNNDDHFLDVFTYF